MSRPRLAGLTPGRLRLGLGLFFAALALPTALLVHHAYGQLKWETFHRHGLLAEEFGARIDSRLAALVAAEEARSVTDYAFLVVAGDPAARYVERSPLAAFPAESDLPGLLGHFQVDADGDFSSPLLPDAEADALRYGVAGAELDARRERISRIHDLLGRSRLNEGSAALPAGGRARDAEADSDARSQPDVGASLADADDARVDSVSKLQAEPVAPQASRDRSFNLAAPAPAADEKKKAPAQALFDRLEAEPARREAEQRGESLRSLGRVEELQLDPAYRAKSDEARQQTSATAGSAAPAPAAPAPRQARKESNVYVAPFAPADTAVATERAEESAAGAAFEAAAAPIRTFESDVDPFRFALLDGDHFLLYRKVWRDGQRTIQGALIERGPFLRELLQEPFAATALARASDLLVAWRGDVLAAFGGATESRYLSSASELRGALLHQARLTAPLSDLELIFSVTRLPPGPGGTLLGWVSAVLAVVLCGGFVLMYRLGLGQVRLAQQQQDFVSAVSHELKTPLTSIRMYGEMLREGWVDEERRRGYYDFIHGESERLSRLIDNVLQLARMNRNGLRVAARDTAAGELLDEVRSKVAAQVERAGFTLVVDCAGDAGAAVVSVDPDHFLQIVINLVDNALKFAAKAERREIVLGCRLQRDRSLLVSVRDYGPGVPRDQMKKIFRLFYRPGNELTRETVGTGIGLALVHQLATAMGGSVDVVNRDPGAEFRLVFASVTARRADP